MGQPPTGSSYPLPSQGKSLSHHQDPTKNFATYQDVAQAVKNWRCTGCSTRIISSEGSVASLFWNWLQRQGPIKSQITCQVCQKQAACMGGCSNEPTKTTTKQGYQISTCCGSGKLFIIWIIMCGFDQAHVQELHQLAKFAQNNTRYSTDGGVGYEGFDFFGATAMSRMRDAETNAGKSKAYAYEVQIDHITQIVLELIAALLPSKDPKSDYDKNPPTAVVSLLRSSRVLDKIAELLRNDSLEDATHRKLLYQSVLDVLRVLSLHSALAEKTIFRERIAKKEKTSMLKLSFHELRRNTGETSSSIADCLKKLNIQSNMMLSGAKNNPQVFSTHQSKETLWLCRQISDLAVFLLGKEKASGVTPSEGKLLEDNIIVKEVDDSILISVHFFGGPATRMQNSAPGRMRKIISELTTLKTGLPPGIFIRYGSSRIDVMKVLMVGPKETPFDLGLFEFDIFLPTEFPNKPPMVYFRGAEGRLCK